MHGFVILTVEQKWGGNQAVMWLAAALMSAPAALMPWAEPPNPQKKSIASTVAPGERLRMLAVIMS